MATKRKPEESPEGATQLRTMRRRDSLPDLRQCSAINGEENVDTNKAKTKSISFQDMITTSLKNEDVINQIAPKLAPTLAEILKPFIQETIVSCVATTVESTMQRVKAELIAPIMSSLSEQSREIEILKKSISDKNDTIETLKVKFSKQDKAISEMNKQIDTVSSELDNLQQYGRRGSLRFFNVPLKENESTDRKIVEICNSLMNLNLSEDDIERSHILNNPRHPTSNQIIVRFRAYKTKAQVYKQKKLLKGNDIFVTEDLTKRNHAIIRELLKLRKANKIQSFWTIDTKIYYRKSDGDNSVRITDMQQLTVL